MKWLRGGANEPLSVSMAGVRLGDRLLVAGGGDPALLSGAAAKTGLTGRACVVDEADARTTSAVAAAERDGALVEGFTASWTSLPFEAGVFDVVILRNVLPGIDEAQQVARLAEALRVLRSGGRGLVIDGTERAGVLAFFDRGTGTSASRHPTERVMESAGYRAVRTLAERAGLHFVEGVKPNA